VYTQNTSTITSITYNGSAMTFIASCTSFAGRQVLAYYITGVTGSHTVSVTATGGGTVFLAGVSESLSGVQQTLPVDTSGNSSSTSATSLSNTLAITNTGEWVVGGFASTGATAITGTGGFNSTTRNTAAITGSGLVGLLDSNGTVTSGSHAYGGSYTGSADDVGLVTVALLAGLVPANGNFLTFM
jgi:hypothetical protein